MKQQFRTTLLAAAVAVSCGSAVAGTVSVTKQTHSKEGLTGVTANQTSNAITYTLGAAYRTGDKITFTFPAGSLAANSYQNGVSVPAVDSATPGNAIAGLALGLLNSTDDSVTYRVTSVEQPDDTPGAGGTAYTDRTTIGAVVPLGTVGYKAAAVLAAPVTVTVTSVTSSGDELDNSTTGRTATVAESKTQFGTATVGTKFDGVVNVSSLRTAFTVGTTDTMSWTITNPTTTGWLNMATVNATNGTIATLYGEPGKMGNVKATQWSTGGTNTFTAADAKLAVAYAGMVTNDTFTFTPLTGTSAVVLEAQKFTTDFVYNYTSAASQAGTATVGTGVASGEWTLNGANVNIPYMPYSPNASQIIYVSNAGTQDGDISVVAFDDKGMEYDLGVIGSAGKKRVTKIAPLITEALLAKGFTGGKLSLTITVNAPDSDITVYSSYNVGGADRGYVNTDQYKGK
jgi:hypothetical protein